MFSADLGVNQVASTPAANDPPFNKVALLLHGDGTNGAQNNTFVDSSTNNFTITRTGNVAQGTFSPFSLADGQWSNYFDGTSAYETVATNSVFTYGTNDFTIECLFYLGKTGAQQQLIDQRNSGTATAIIPTLYVSSSNVLTYYVNGSAVITGSTTLSVGSWYHVAVARSSTSTKMFLNGTQEGSTYSDSNNYAASRVVLGAQASSAANYLQGYLSNVRLVNGTAVYTSNFTAPTSALTAITNTSLLTCQSNRFIDNSSNNFTITLSGTPKVTAWSPFAPSAAYSASTNGGSAYFDGSGDYLSVADNANLRFGTSAFTIQAWVYRNAAGTAHSIVSKGGASTGFTLGITSTNILRFTDTTTNIDTTTTIPAGTWTHVAAVRTNTSTNGFQLYINGVSSKTATVSTDFNQTNTLYVGADRGAANVMNGYITDLRYVNGTAETITVPTAPLTAVTNTQLLLNCTNAGIFDNAGKNDIETVGNAQISTSVKKYGTGSMYFDGTGDYLKMPSNEALKRDGDFTVEAWVYPTSVSSDRAVAGMYVSGVGGWVFYISGGYLWFSSGFNNYSSTGVCVSANQWQHIAAVISNGNLYLFVDGVQKNTTTNVSASNWSILRPLVVGSTDNGSIWPFIGYIDDLRITKGQALYTSNFTVPAQAFPNV